MPDDANNKSITTLRTSGVGGTRRTVANRPVASCSIVASIW
jgi:hypothetical protein